MCFIPARFPREIKWNKYLPGKGARQKHELCLPRPSFLLITASLMLLTRTPSIHHQSNEIQQHSACFRLLFSCALLFQSGRNKPFHFDHSGLGTENLPGLVRVLHSTDTVNRLCTQHGLCCPRLLLVSRLAVYSHHDTLQFSTPAVLTVYFGANYTQTPLVVAATQGRGSRRESQGRWKVQRQEASAAQHSPALQRALLLSTTG